MNSDLQNNTFIGFLDPKNIGKGVSFIILACFVILHYISSSHFEKTAKKHVFTRGILLYFFLVISKTPRRQNQQKSFDLEFFPRLGYFGLCCLQYYRIVFPEIIRNITGNTLRWHIYEWLKEDVNQGYYFLHFLPKGPPKKNGGILGGILGGMGGILGGNFRRILG